MGAKWALKIGSKMKIDLAIEKDDFRAARRELLEDEETLRKQLYEETSLVNRLLGLRFR